MGKKAKHGDIGLRAHQAWSPRGKKQFVFHMIGTTGSLRIFKSSLIVPGFSKKNMHLARQ